ncbi:hypothetical protein EI94DRAFT_1817166 [Lactarius quietus]|nr:hypothetical protein EI94DRAFT_1817166 [Lactarius quietus]
MFTDLTVQIAVPHKDTDDADADILQALTQDIDSSTVDPEQWPSAQSDHLNQQHLGLMNQCIRLLSTSNPEDQVLPHPWSSNHFRMVSQVHPSPVNMKDHMYITQVKKYSSRQSGHHFALNVTGRLHVGPKCVGRHLQPWQICLQYPSWKVVDRLELSYRTPKQLNEIINDKLPGCPPFQCHEIVMANETLQFYFRDILQSIRSLFGDPKFAHDMVYAPECHYANSEWSSHVYSEMHTGDWWWAVQTSLEGQRPGTSVVPIIISSDKMQLTLFHGKVTYPVYLTIGNIPKAIHRKPTHQAQMLIAYIPTSHLEDMGNQTA